MIKTIMLGLVLAAVALSGAIYVVDLKTIPSFTYVAETEHIDPSDAFPIKSSDMQQGSHGIGQITGPPVVSMSRLPNINETAVVEITYTNQIGLDVTEDHSMADYLKVGWIVSSGFEIVDSGGVEPWTANASKNDPPVLMYKEFVPLDVGESKTYRIEIRAVNEGTSYVTGLGYDYTFAHIFLYLNDEETLPYDEHRERYPEMHERQVRAESQPPPPPTKAERAALMASTPPYVAPTRETVMEWFADFFEGEKLNPEVGLALDMVLDFGASVNMNMTDVRQILSDAGYSDGEIDDAVSGYASTQSSARSSYTVFLIYGWMYNEEMSFGKDESTRVNGAQICAWTDSNISSLRVHCTYSSDTGTYKTLQVYSQIKTSANYPVHEI